VVYELSWAEPPKIDGNAVMKKVCEEYVGGCGVAASVRSCFQLRLKARLIVHASIIRKLTRVSRDPSLIIIPSSTEHPTQWQIAPAETVMQSQINLPRLDWHDKEVGVNGRSVVAVYALARDADLLSTPPLAFLGGRGRDI